MQSARSIRVAALVAGLGQSLAGSAAALLGHQVGDSDADAGFTQTMLVIGAGGAALALSELTRLRGRRAALVAGVLAAAVGCGVVVVGGSLGSLELVLLGHLLLGAGTSTVMLGRYAAADLEPEARRPAAMVAVLTATTVGAVAGANLLSVRVELAARLPWGFARAACSVRTSWPAAASCSQLSFLQQLHLTPLLPVRPSQVRRRLDSAAQARPGWSCCPRPT